MVYAIIFFIIQICNLVLASLRFDKVKRIASIIEVITPIIGLAGCILFVFSPTMAAGLSVTFFTAGVMAALPVIRKYKYSWIKYVTIAHAVMTVILSIIYGATL